ncbi:class I SAM-dependent methyltransferase [Saccharothrix texasensis]|nr:class I SAM-dependent methyltransferase [Saccharothrix texasensis]
MPPEVAIIADYGSELRKAMTLELGAGGGRLTAALATISKSLVATDFSIPMTRKLKERLPGITVSQVDARNLHSFRAEEFDLCWFGYNGIDSIPIRDRRTVFSEVRNVLRCGGLFIFSTHDRTFAETAARTPIPVRPWRLGETKRFFRCVFNRARMRRYQEFGEDYALVNDRALNFGLMTYYVDRKWQNELLAEESFRVLSVYATDGSRWENCEQPTDKWHYFVCKAI